MAIFNGGRMVALFLCALFAPNASFAQDSWQTIVVYIADPIDVDEQLAPDARAYFAKWWDPLTWVTFERDFTPAREAQIAQINEDNKKRIQAAEVFLRKDMMDRGDDTSSWYPSWIPLGAATTAEDSLFKNILDLPGRIFDKGPRRGQPLLLREFFEADGEEPFGLDSLGNQNHRRCEDGKRRCRPEFYADFRTLLDLHDASLASESVLLHDDPPPVMSEADSTVMSKAAPPIISFTIRVKGSPGPLNEGFVGQINEEGREEDLNGADEIEYAEFDFSSIKLLQPAVMDTSIHSMRWQPAAKPVSSTEPSSWGRIKATFAD